MTKIQQGDVALIQTNDDGDISVENGFVTMTPGLETSVYLSLFGGNEQDSGIGDDPKNWWGNLSENEPSRRYRSVTQYLLRSLPTTSANLGRIEDAAKLDLEWLVTEKVASEINVTASIPGVNKIRISIDIEARGEESSFEFVENWKASA